MVNYEIVNIIESKLSEGMGIQAICNMLVQSGYVQPEVDAAVSFVQNKKTREQANMMKGNTPPQAYSGQQQGPPPQGSGNYPQYNPPFQKYDKYLDGLENRNNMLAAYAVAAVMLIISAVAAMYLFGFF
jgi:hypothetical protein